MLKAILDAATAFFVVVAAFLFWSLANKYGARISVRRFMLILVGLALILWTLRGWGLL